MNTQHAGRHLIIGIGSPFGDDQAGWRVIEQLQRMDLPPEVQLLSLDRPGPALIEQMQGYTSVILIDALRTDQYPPGTCLEVTPEQLTSLDPISSHGFGLSVTLALAQQLDQLPLNLRLLGISICRPVARNDISMEVTNAAWTLAQRLARRYKTSISIGIVRGLKLSTSSDR